MKANSSNVAVFFNTDKLGGAERSLLLQLPYCQNMNYTFFIPIISKSTDIEKYIEEKKLGKICRFGYPLGIYQMSRSKMGISFLLFVDVLKLILGFFEIKNINSFDIVYLNGNKSAFLFFLLNLKLRLSCKVVWHQRDYFTNNKFSNYIWKSLLKYAPVNFEIICNSHSVLKSLSGSPLQHFKSQVIYNPSGMHLSKRAIGNISIIGFASLMAPWKGVHEILLFAWMYEKKLKEIGIKEIKIFGDDFYHTKGEHQNYKNELKRMIEKMPTDLISFEGVRSPEFIFENIDCLVHYSLAPEPFGRVIVEAYDSNVPVITTGLGGAGEILDDEINGFKVIPYDRRDLFQKIEALVGNNFLVKEFINKSQIKSKNIQLDIDTKMSELLRSTS